MNAPRRYGFHAVVAILAIAFATSAFAADKKKITGTNKDGQILSQSSASPGDDPNHSITQLVGAQRTTSNNADWNNTQLIFYEHDDFIGGTGPLRGYGTHTHANGDKSYFNYEGTSKMTTKDGGAWEQIGDGRFTWTGGTGKFKTLKGGGTYKCKFTPDSGQCDWLGEAEY
jgi:hypothetical protein